MSVNERMSEAWNGQESVHYVDHADRHDRQLEPVTRLILEAADIGPDDAVLDIGCGCGAMALVAARRARRVVGLDISDPLVRVARSRVEVADHERAEFIVGDAQIHEFDDGEFDVVVSQFGLMFFDDPAAAFANMHRSLRPGGRLTFACWRDLGDNDWLRPVVRAVEAHADVPDLGGMEGGGGMFAFKHDDEVADLLTVAGFTDVAVDPVSPRLLIGGGGSVDDSTGFLLGLGIVRGLLGRLDDEQRVVAESSIRDELERHHDEDGVRLGSGVWLATATA